MPLVNAKCTNCGGTLTVDASKEAAICDFCGSPYIVEKAIQNYNYYVTQNIKADNINVTAKGEAEKERLLHNAETYTSFKDYDKALDIYKQITEDYPDDYRGWYGLVQIETENFELFYGTKMFNLLCSYMDRALMTTPPDQKTAMQEKWEQYQQNYVSFKESKSNTVVENQNKSASLQIEIQASEERLNSYNKKIKSNGMRQKDGIIVLIGITAFLSIICLCVIVLGWFGAFKPDYTISSDGSLVKNPWYSFHMFCIYIFVFSIPALIVEAIIHVIVKGKAKKKGAVLQSQSENEYNKHQQLISEKQNVDSQIEEIKEKYNI